MQIAPSDSKTGRPEQLPRGRHGLTREAVTESQRSRIITAMVTAVAERGYGDARVVDAISIAGVSRKTFYELFRDKEDCFLVAYDDCVRRLFGATQNAYDSEPDAPWTDRVRAAMTAMVGFLAANPDAARFMLIEVLAAGPKALARRDAAIRQFTEFVDAGRAEASIDMPGITSTAIIGGLYELLYSEILHGATAQLPSRLPDIIYWVVQPYLGPDRAAEERERTRRELSVQPAGA
jgi:AcrR family transcriptional regulator